MRRLFCEGACVKVSISWAWRELRITIGRALLFTIAPLKLIFNTTSSLRSSGVNRNASRAARGVPVISHAPHGYIARARIISAEKLRISPTLPKRTALLSAPITSKKIPIKPPWQLIAPRSGARMGFRMNPQRENLSNQSTATKEVASEAKIHTVK